MKHFLFLCAFIITSIAVGQKIELSSSPFTSSPATKTQFQAITDHIYGKLSLDKALKNYITDLDNYQKQMQVTPGTFVAAIRFRINFLDPDLQNESYTIVELFLKESDLTKTELNFDIIPSAELASSCTSAGFYDELASSSKVYRYFGAKKEVQIELYKKSTQAFQDDILITSAKFTIDYSAVDYENISQWKSECSEIHSKVKDTYFK